MSHPLTSSLTRRVAAAICCPRGCDAQLNANEFAVCQAHTWIEEANAALAIVAASGMEAPSGGETAKTGSAECDSPTAEGGDAQGTQP
jgi:hypothetical protein